jgi:ubiquinone/menaquinone biosynthesis C-methylase UbiE
VNEKADAVHESHYVLQHGDQGAKRLRLLTAITLSTTKTLLQRAGLRQGMDCLDVGCGNGMVTIEMAESVAPSGHVVGTDVDEHCLTLARHEALSRDCSVEFRTCDASKLEDESKYDFVLARFLLSHLREPENALKRMVYAARPGGVLVVEDIQFTGHFCHPASKSFDRYVSLYQSVVSHNGADPNIGPLLPNMFLDAELEEVELQVIQPTFQKGPGKTIASSTMENIRESLVSAGLATDGEIGSIVAELNSFAMNPRTLMSLPRIFQVWGKRPV